MIDLSYLYTDGHFGIGLTAQNIGPDLKYTGTMEIEQLPSLIRFGVAYKILESNLHNILISGDLTPYLNELVESEKIGDILKEMWSSVGLEYSRSKWCFLRCGYFRDVVGKRVGWTYGAGVRWEWAKFDIATDEDIYAFPTSNWKFSLGFSF